MWSFSEAPLTDAEIEYLCEGIAQRPAAWLDGVRIDMEVLIVFLMGSGPGRAGLRRKIFENDIREFLGLQDHVDVRNLCPCAGPA